jgi:hypothetical protein
MKKVSISLNKSEAAHLVKVAKYDDMTPGQWAKWGTAALFSQAALHSLNRLAYGLLRDVQYVGDAFLIHQAITNRGCPIISGPYSRRSAVTEYNMSSSLMFLRFRQGDLDAFIDSGETSRE